MAHQFAPGFFDRADPGVDRDFYSWPRLVTHIDDGAIAAVGALYEELAIDGDVLDLMSSWVSHFRRAPSCLVALGMNPTELAANAQARAGVVHDLNEQPVLPFRSASFDAVVCCVSVDYLIRPVEVFRDVARVLRPNGVFVCTFSNRCFPTKAIRGWLASSDEQHCTIVAEYFRSAGRFAGPVVARRTPAAHRGDPLFAVWEPVGRLSRLMKAFQRGLLVAAIAVAVSVVVRVRGKGRVPQTSGGWRELRGPDLR